MREKGVVQMGRESKRIETICHASKYDRMIEGRRETENASAFAENLITKDPIP